MTPADCSPRYASSCPAEPKPSEARCLNPLLKIQDKVVVNGQKNIGAEPLVCSWYWHLFLSAVGKTSEMGK